jgi:hypothetical protein
LVKSQGLIASLIFAERFINLTPTDFHLTGRAITGAKRISAQRAFIAAAAAARRSS